MTILVDSCRQLVRKQDDTQLSILTADIGKLTDTASWTVSLVYKEIMSRYNGSGIFMINNISILTLHP